MFKTNNNEKYLIFDRIELLGVNYDAYYNGI